MRHTPKIGEDDVMHTSGESDSRVHKRNLVSSIFVGLLLALAYDELLSPVKSYIRTHGLDISVVAMFLIFFLMSSRFFVGTSLHLVSDELTTKPGKVWFLDFSVNVIEMLAFILLAGLSSPTDPALGPIGFFDVLVFILLLDLAWIFVQAILSARVPGWKRESIPWGWGAINLGLLIAIGVVWIVTRDLLLPLSLAVLATLSIPAFIADIMLLDQYDLL